MYADPHTGDTGTAVCTVPTRTIGGTGKLERGKGVDSVEGGSSLRRKNTKNRRGWGNLPVNVLQ